MAIIDEIMGAASDTTPKGVSLLSIERDDENQQWIVVFEVNLAFTSFDVRIPVLYDKIKDSSDIITIAKNGIVEAMEEAVSFSANWKLSSEKMGELIKE